MKRGCIFTSKPIWNDTVLKAENGTIPFPELRHETNNLEDGAGMVYGKFFTLREGTYEIDVEAIAKGAMGIQLCLAFGDSLNNERLCYRGMVAKATSSPSDIRNVRLRTYFSCNGKDTHLYVCFMADSPEIILPSERLWNNYSIRGMLTMESKDYTPAFDLRAIDRETWNYKKPDNQIIK